MFTLQRISITALMALVFGTATASAGQLPQYEVTGFPISPSQMSVIKPSIIQEQPSTPTLTLDGMQLFRIRSLSFDGSRSSQIN